MAYSKTDWTNNTSPHINATNLDKMETGIDEAHDAIENTSTGHDHDGTDSKKVIAGNVINTPAGSIAATDVQTAIDELDTEKLAKASNLSDVANAATSFGNIKQSATESATGAIEKATTAECVTGTDTDRAVTPAGLTARMGAPGEIGGTTPAAGNFTTGDFSDDIDQGGNYLLNSESVNALNAKGAGYWFDGDNDKITLSESMLNFDVVTNDFSIEFIFKNDGSSVTGALLDKRDGNDDGYRLSFITGEPFMSINTIDIIGTLITDEKYHHIIAVCDRKADGQIYNNGIASGAAVDISGEVMSTTAIPTIGANAAGGANIPLPIFLARIWNRAPSVAEVKALSSGAPIDFADIGANQTLIVPSDDCADDDTANWTDVNGALTFDTNHYVYTVATGASVASFADEAALTVGKRYRATVLVKDGTGTGSTVRINSLTNADVVIENGTSITVDGTYATASVEWIATETNNKVQIEIIAGSVSDGETILFDEIETNHIGCVLQLEQDGIGHNQWLDKSGNENHGTVTGALPINLPVDHQEKYIDLAVTNDTNFTLPKGYLISSIVLTSDGAIGGGIDIGTTDGGGEIVTAQAIAGAGTVLCTLVAGANYNTTGADDTIYITDADGTGWDGASVIVRVQMQRVEL